MAEAYERQATETFANASPEHMLIGALLLDRDAIVAVADTLPDTDFAHPSARAAYQAIRRLWARREPPDLATVAAEVAVTNARRPDEVELTAWMMEAMQKGYAVHAPAYAAAVTRQARRRRFVEGFQDELAKLYADPDMDPLDALAAIADVVGNDDAREAGPRGLDALIAETTERIMAERAGTAKREVIPTGIADLDALLGGGLGRGDLCTLAARSGMGKTALATHILTSAAASNQGPALMFSMEVGDDALARRLLSRESGVDHYDVRTANLSDDAFAQVSVAGDAAQHLPVWIDTTPGITTDKIRARAQRLAAERGRLSLIVVDYLELLGDGLENDRMPDHSRYARIVPRLKFLARICDCAVLLLAQVQREVDTRQDKMPMLHHIAQSSMIEKTADQVVLFTVYDHYVGLGTEEPDPERAGKIDILLAKHRNGDKGRFQIGYDPRTMAYRNLTTAGASDPWDDLPAGW